MDQVVGFGGAGLGVVWFAWATDAITNGKGMMPMVGIEEGEESGGARLRGGEQKEVWEEK